MFNVLHARIMRRARGCLLAAAALLLASCASSPPVQGAEEQRFPSLETIAPVWRPLVQADSPATESAVVYFAARVQKPRLRIRAVRVDLSDPAVRIVVNGARLEPGVIPAVKVSSFVAQYGCLAGINATPFRPASAREGEARTIVGLSVSDGRLISPPQSPYDALVFYADGKAAIIKQAEYNADAGTPFPAINAAGGFFTVLRGGAVVEAARRRTERHPRSAAGLSPEGGLLYLLVVDGRQFSSIGATEAELAVILSRLGATDGLAFDGGGSSALAVRVPDAGGSGAGRVRVVNTPVHNHIPGRERAVGTCLGVRLISGSGPRP
jgi:hypothetical protein